jgi:rhodanese-related sulfurtransferase
MNRRFILEAATLVAAAILCAVVANAMASRERKLKLVPTPMPVRAAVPSSTTAVVPGPESAVPGPEPAKVPGPESVTTSTANRSVIAPAQKSAQADPGSGTSDPGPGTQKPVTPAAKPAKTFPPHPDKAWAEIDPDSVRQLYARGVPFIDARRTADYEMGHIRGARSMPVWESDLDDRLKAIYEEGLDPEAPLVVYCSGGNCEDSHMLSQRLWGLGFNNVLVYKDGYPDWVANKGPTQTGSSPR